MSQSVCPTKWKMSTQEASRQKNFPQFDKPRPVGYFSIIGAQQRLYVSNATKLRYYKTPTRFPIDLNLGMDRAIKKPESAYDERLDNLLKFIFDHQKNLFATNLTTNEPRLEAEFICWRGLLRLVMCSPYEHQQNWCIHVTRYMGTFYLCKRDTYDDQLKREQEDWRQRTFCAYGFKFEQHCLSGSPYEEVNASVPVDECGEFVCAFKSSLCGMKMLFGAEIDGIVSEQPVDLDGDTPPPLHSLKFIEIKTGLADKSQRQENTFRRFTTRNWWCQSFLVGIEDIYIGKRTAQGFVHNVEHMPVKMLPKLSKDWSPAVCCHFLVDFLQNLQKLMASINCPHTTYLFTFTANKGLITHKIYQGKTEHSFLPDWYIAMIQSMAEACKPEEYHRVKLKRTIINDACETSTSTKKI